jgi:hypothetical protein
VTRILVSAPRWVTYALIIVAALAVVGWVKPYLQGPDLAFSTIYRPRPVPVKVDTTAWLKNAEPKIKYVRVPVEVPVIVEVPAKVQQRFEEDFGIKLPELRAENRELVDILAVPKAPRGGEMALVVNTSTGKIDGTFHAHTAPLLELGGLREAGIEYDPMNAMAAGYYRQDLVRVGPAVVSGKVFAGVPVAPGKQATAGVAIGVAVRF